MSNVSKSVKLGVFTLAIMNVTAVVSLRELPAEVEYGLSSAFYYLFAALVFLIPTSLVAAELAAMFQDKQGGVFRWVGEAYGKKFGFLPIFLQWMQSTIWYPTVLTFGAVSLAFIGTNPSQDMNLASNRYYSLAMVLIIYWLATFISLKGMDWVGKVAKIGGLVGTILPAVLLMVLTVVYLTTSGQSQMDFNGPFFPDLTHFNNLVLASSIFLFYAGMEMGGIHVKDMVNPAKNYPKAIFTGAAITVTIFVLGTFANGVQKNILMVQGVAVTLLSLLFVVMPSVQSFYQILSQLTVMLYLIMCMLIFSAAIHLRYNLKKAQRPFRIGSHGNGLMWFVAGLSFCGSLLAFVLSFIPPAQIAVSSTTVWHSVLILGSLVVVSIPFLIYHARKPEWVNRDAQFEPFHWEDPKEIPTDNRYNN